MLVKLVLEAQTEADYTRAVREAKCLAGGLVKGSVANPLHYTEGGSVAKGIWRKWGFRVVAEGPVELDDAGLEKLLADLEKL